MGVEEKIKYQKLSIYLKKILPGIENIVVLDGIVVITINKNFLFIITTILKLNIYLNMGTLLDIWAVDYPGKLKRFEINYLFCSIKNNFRVIVRTFVKENETIRTVSDIFSSACWLEREIWDLYGIFFYKNLDLRRILTDYGFEGYPLRKDFPMSGFVEIRYDDTEKRIVQEYIEVAQEYRVFNFKSPWEKL